jgi:hypothetical protein
LELKSTNSNTIRTLFAPNWFLATFLFLVCLVPGAANAQNVVSGKFHLKNEVRWGLTVLQPGDYTITVPTVASIPLATIANAEGKNILMVSTMIRGEVKHGESSLLIVTNGTQRVVHSLNLSQLGVSLIYQSGTKTKSGSPEAKYQIEHVLLAQQ